VEPRDEDLMRVDASEVGDGARVRGVHPFRDGGAEICDPEPGPSSTRQEDIMVGLLEVLGEDFARKPCGFVAAAAAAAGLLRCNPPHVVVVSYADHAGVGADDTE